MVEIRLPTFMLIDPSIKLSMLISQHATFKNKFAHVLSNESLKCLQNHEIIFQDFYSSSNYKLLFKPLFNLQFQIHKNNGWWDI